MNLRTYFSNLVSTCLLTVLSFSFLSCKKLVTVDTPVNELASAAVFADAASVEAATRGLYSEIMRSNNNLLNGGTTFYAALSADELDYSGTVANQLEFYQNNLVPANTVLGASLWRAGYSTIYHANALIEGLAAAKGLPATLVMERTAEARLVRAWNYMYLAGLFGKVPLITTTDYRVAAEAPRKPLAAIWEQVIADLREAKTSLPAAYPTAGRVRPNRWAATALLARAFLYTGQWAAADSAAAEVISAGPYSLVPNPANAFLAGSAEAIWQLAPADPNFNTWEALNFLPASPTVRPGMTLSADLLNAFEAGDNRKGAWTGVNTVSNVAYYYPAKYKVRMGTTVSENYTVIRLAEIYLVRAEARVHTGDLQGAQADLDKVRARAGLPGTTATDTAALLRAIEQERRIELVFEWGHRWFDLKRTGRAEAVLAYKPGWQATDTLYPIPFSEIQLNPFLTQNEGYQ
jgi:hypothetical protein